MHSDKLCDDEITLIRGIPTTTAARTAFDLGRRYGLTLAVIRLDAVMQATQLKTTDIDALIDRHRAARGIVQLRKAGWRIIRVSANMLRYRPGTIVERTRAALVAAGWSNVDLWS